MRNKEKMDSKHDTYTYTKNLFHIILYLLLFSTGTIRGRWVITYLLCFLQMNTLVFLEDKTIVRASSRLPIFVSMFVFVMVVYFFGLTKCIMYYTRPADRKDSIAEPLYNLTEEVFELKGG